MTPVYGMVSVAIILLGIFRLFTTKYTARSYIISAWFVFIVPIVIINPQYSNVLFIPSALLLAMGVRTLITRWYRLFPRNPYARIIGIIPLAILVVSMTLTGAERYLYGYHYDPTVARNFSKDITLLNKEVPRHPIVTLVVSSDEKPFFDVVAKYNQKLIVMPTIPAPGADMLITNAAKKLRPAAPAEPERIITDRQSDDSDRFYAYKNRSK
jgi:hypothetical protein